MTSIIESLDDIQAGLLELAKLDPRLVEAIRLSTDIPLRRSEGGYEGLARIIVGQQVSTASAQAIWNRFAAAFAPFEPEAILAASDEALKACGLSMPKIRGLRAVAEAIVKRHIEIDALAAMEAEAAHAALTAIKGVGPWTADVYLLACIGHVDAFPSGDIALQEAARMAFDLPARPDAKTLLAISEIWKPWRAVAARLLWRYYAVRKQRDGAPIPT